MLHQRRPGPKQEHTAEFKQHWQQQMAKMGAGKGGKNNKRGASQKGGSPHSKQRMMHPGGFRPLVPVASALIAEQLLGHIDSNQVIGLVVGMPVAPGGKLDHSCRRSQDFVRAMQQNGGVPEGLPVFWQDETNTTKEAEQWAATAGLGSGPSALYKAHNALKRNHKEAKGLIDQEAACVLLRRFKRNMEQASQAAKDPAVS